MSYTHFTTQERIFLELYLDQGLSKTEIARKLGRSRSSIYREIKRNSEQGCYSAFKAHERYIARKKLSGRKIQMYIPLLNYFNSRLKKSWSPEQIAKRLPLDYPDDPKMRSSFKTIYNWIYAGLLKVTKKVLRFKGKRKPNNYDEKRGKFQIKLPIEERPREIETRETFGHWEIDTVEGKKGSGYLLTINERENRFVIAYPMKDKRASTVNTCLSHILSCLPCGSVKSITSDRGKEFSGYEEIMEKFGIPIYFANPHSPWERGSNENTNGLLREYFPKGSDFSKITVEEVAEAVRKINGRPRKVLGWKSANECFRESLEKCCT
jgi:IS30 family transposase